MLLATRIAMTPAKPRKSPRQRRSKETVEAMIQAAARVLQTQGAQALTTNEIARVAGVSVGSLYQYFPDKDSIVVALVEYQLEKDREELAYLLANRDDLSIRQHLAQIMQQLCARQVALGCLPGQLLPLLSKLRSEDLVHRIFQEMSQMMISFVQDHAASLRPQYRDPIVLEHAMFVLTHGIRGALNAATVHDFERVRDPIFVGQIVDLALAMLLPDQAEAATSQVSD